MQAHVNRQYRVSPYLAFFLIYKTQFGVGVLGFQRYISKASGHDAWIAVILSGLIIHLLLWMMYQILNKEQNDLISIHQTVFGKWIGNLLSFLFILQVFISGTTVLRTFIEVIQVWVFPLFKTWPFALVFLTSAYYIVSNGFRTVAGVCYFGSIIPLILIPTFLAPLEFANFRNLLPVMDHSITDLIKSVEEMTFTILGFELLLLYYPYFIEPEKSQKWTHYGNLFTTLIYAGVAIVTFAYYGEDHLQVEIWPTLTMWKVIKLPVLERIEYVAISAWTIIILPNICTAFWAASRGVKRIFQITQRSALLILLAGSFIITCLLNNRMQIDHLNSFVSMIGIYLLYAYIPILFIIYHIRHKMRKRS
ncbi:spore germination protein (amino acid permease) [Laceyella sediminis]|uniref:Spore germination protein (Amino acid permease) n=1 Tax=Laceyella sediminis TaxID=573074 RepID=A0ABX5EN17_9BACL|nr:GerAB/ArcD/ProY family transporter [Laceyella sediminis]PRZ12496.1 spore germination protein (amino acid permease) [Laceyella sediminis]